MYSYYFIKNIYEYYDNFKVCMAINLVIIINFLALNEIPNLI